MMRLFSCSHWGVFEAGDNALAENVFYDGDGAVYRLECDQPTHVSSHIWRLDPGQVEYYEGGRRVPPGHIHYIRNIDDWGRSVADREWADFVLRTGRGPDNYRDMPFNKLKAVRGLYRAHRWERDQVGRPNVKYGLNHETETMPDGHVTTLRVELPENFYSTGSCAHMGHP